MKNLEKVELIQKICSDNNITAYEIGKNTSLSVYAVQKLLSGETKKPNNKTLNIVLDFLESAIVGGNPNTSTAESVVLDNTLFDTRKKLDALVRFLHSNHTKLLEDPLYSLWIENIEKEAIIEYEKERIRKKAINKNSKA